MVTKSEGPRATAASLLPKGTERGPKPERTREPAENPQPNPNPNQLNPR